MAVTVTPVDASGDFRVWDITAADGDTTASITHGFGAAPQDITLRPLDAACYIAVWTVAVSSSTITLTKGTGTGSGSANAQIRVQARLPHSIGA